MRATNAINHRRAGLPIGEERRGERGASLVIALAVIMLLSVMAAAVLTYAETAYRGTGGYRNQRDERYAGDGAIASAVNYAKQQSNLLVDPDLSADVCRQYVPSEVGVVTVSCEADAGSGSGVPADVGLVPPESLLLLSTRHTQPGPYNAPQCSGWGDDFGDFFDWLLARGVEPEATGPAEYGGWFRMRRGHGLLNFNCNSVRTRPSGEMAIRGNVYAAGQIVAADGLNVSMTDGVMWARAGCAGPIVSQCLGAPPGDRTAMPGQPHLAGTRPDTDPGRPAPNNTSDQPISSSGALDVADSWQPVGFDANGAPRNLGYAMPMAGGNQTTMPERTTAYTWNSATNVFTPTPVGACPNNTATIVFLPGWYRNSEVLSRYTTSSTCRDVNFWFAPNPGPDGVLLTEDDETGAYYFDFTVNHTRRCGPAGDNGSAAPAHVGRWCVGGAPDQNARIVAGTPLNWSPIGVYTEGSGSTPDSVRMVIDTATTVDLDLSQSWRSTPAPRPAAREIDGTAAHYRADICIFGLCFAQDRAIRLRDLTPRATSPAMALPGAPNGRVYLTVSYAVENPGSAQPAEAVIEAVSAQSGRHQCGTYVLYGNAAAPAPFNDRTGAAGDGDNLHAYTFTDAQAEELALRCGALDRLNGLEVKVQVRGNTLNVPRTDWWLDGIRLEYDTVPSATFPEPVGDNDDGLPTVAAQSDCDPAAPGAQFTFGGTSHIYVADGSLEICAGPHPDNPAEKQSIGLWALPPINEVSPTGIGALHQDIDSICAASPNGGNPLAAVANIDGSKPGGAQGCSQNDRGVLAISYSGFCICDIQAGVDVEMGGYTPPPGFRISRVEARVSYNPKNNCVFLFQCPGADPRFEPRVGGGAPCGSMNMPKNPDNGPLQFGAIHRASLVMYDGTRNCVGVTAGGASMPATTARWWARGGCFLLGCNYRDSLDGIRYEITIEPTSTTTARLRPQSGCIIGQPNYNAGYGMPDCAVVRADTGDAADNWSLPWTAKEGQWRGRFSVKGTIWAPGSAIEVDDSDVAYPLATRGAVMRHLRVSGWGARPGYNLPAFDNYLDLTPAPREGTFVACLQSDGRRSEGHPCGEGPGGDQDRILSRARAFFLPIADPSVPNSWDWDADIQWWDNRR